MRSVPPSDDAPPPNIANGAPASEPPVAKQILPPSLAALPLGPWRWAGPGLRLASVGRAAGLGERVKLLQGRPGATLPPHGHTGEELTLVLQGAYVDGGHTYRAGDISARDADDPTHELAVTGDELCVCLVVTDGPLRFKGMARWLQPVLDV